MSEMKYKKILGIDVGGTGIKGAPVHTKKGKLLVSRHRIPTPESATPADIAEVIQKIVKHFNWEGPVGIGFPAAIQKGVAKTAANIDSSFVGTDVNKLFSDKTGLPVTVVNDADAAGLAEMKFGAGKGNKGVVFLVTVGAGLGTVYFTRGKLLPNCELGHIYMPQGEAEKYCSDAVRKEEDLSWEEWAGRFGEYLRYMEFLTYPDLIIIGGGASKKPEKFVQYLKVDTPVKMAELQNNAGIVGAALAARIAYKNSKS